MTLPATLPEIVAAVLAVLDDGAAWDEEDLLDVLQQRGVDLGTDPDAVLSDVLDSEDVGLVLPLHDDRWVLLPALLKDRVLTHRVTAAEVDGGYLGVSPDLEPISILTEDATYTRLTDGTSLTEVLPELDASLLKERGIELDGLDEAIWLLEPDTLRRLDVAAGDLVGVTVRSDGFELVAVTEPEEDADDLGAALADVVEEYGGDHPLQIDSTVWQAGVDVPDLFTSPGQPLADAFASAGLAVAGEQVAPPGFDFSRWRANNRIHHLKHAYRLEHDEAVAVLALSGVYEQMASVLEQAQGALDAGEDLETLFDGPDAGDPSSATPSTGADSLRMPSQEVVRDLLELLDEPPMAYALLAETIGAGREGAAALGLFAETLEPQAPRPARPNLRWLRGKALERLGEVLEAEAAYEEALAMDPSCLPALYELARIASDRGDAERGLSLLRRAGAPQDDDLVVLLERFRSVERTDLGRNDRCWCGSGRKYKVCHRNRETLPLEDRAAWLYQKAGSYVTDGPWRTDIVDLAAIRTAHWDAPDALWQGLTDPLVADALMFEGGAFQEFLDERGVLLPEDELLLAQQWLLAERSVHEIEAVSPGQGFTSRDVRAGDRLEVREHTASRALRAGMLICARLVPAGDSIQIFGGLEPVALHERDDLVALLDDEPEPEEVVAFLSRRFAPPTLQNTEGDPLVFCETTLRTDEPAALAAYLDEHYERVDEAAGDRSRWHEEVVTHGMPRTRATLALEGDRLLVKTNSEARMDRVLTMLREPQLRLDLVEQVRRPVEDVREAMDRAPDVEPGAILDPADPEIAAMLGQLMRQYEEAWLDEPIPALSGFTPREAAADPTRRPDLIRLLDGFPPTRPEQPGMDPDRLRAALGL